MANGNANAFRVLICGHSHVYWLKKEWQNFEKACPLTQATVSFLAVRGAKVAQFETETMLDRIKRGRYDIVIFHLGGNDLDSETPPQAIGMQLYMLSKRVVQSGVKLVIMGQVVRRQKWRHISPEEGSKRVFEINDFWRVVAARDISTWKHRRMWQSQSNLFRKDGVHFNAFGNFRFFRSMRGAIINGCKTLVSRDRN